ncbi:exonuclease SbcCD subunit D [Rathayibacter soli]|uniref:exonuclease SbcCD subunit D n=1 Tax=Rathayibacter soli TaxID=3144168 RepID=UPI0027E4C800|nr:exonuclease SbcCD subunit D [Glaciibacter superstes]
MRILHTSDWHIGRTFHGHSTLGALGEVLRALTAIIAERNVDVVAIAGDVFDSAAPSADCFELLTSTLADIRAADAEIVMTSGNHDSATRLGFQSAFTTLAGIHVITRVEQHDQPVTIDGVDFFGIPYLEPSLIRHKYPDATLRTQAQVIAFAMGGIRSRLAGETAPGGSPETSTDRASKADASPSIRKRPSVVLTHCFAAGVEASDILTDIDREIRAGGLDVVPLSTFDGPDYVALGHIHSRAELARGIRYSGAPLHYSFSEAGKPRGVWLVDLDTSAGGHAHDESALHNVEWVELPVPRPLVVLTGTLDKLLTDAAYEGFEGHWVSAILTDTTRPIDAMRKLQARFPHCATIDHKPATVAEVSTASYAERIKARSDTEIITGFLEHVRNGDGPSETEAELIADVLSEHRAAQAVA